MVLPRPSNTGIMIGAVMVGLLGFGACLFIKYAPKSLLREITSLSKSDTSHAKEPPETAKSKSARESAIELQGIEKDLTPLFTAWQGKQKLKKNAIDSLASKAKRAASLNQNVLLDKNFKPKFKRKAQFIALAITFQITQIDPNQQAAFFSVSDSIIKNSDSSLDIANAAGLQLIVKNNLRQPDYGKLARDLSEFSQQHQSIQAGVGVYAMVARELSFHGHEPLAQQVLRLGIRKYDGRHVTRLIELLKNDRIR